MNGEVFDDLERAILEYDGELAISSIKKVVQEKQDILKALEVMTSAIRKVGEGFAKGELWLPDLVGAGQAMSSAMPIIDDELKKGGGTKKNRGTIVIGTVFGDMHSIGKNLVKTLLAAEGFDVYDLGVNVEPQVFFQSAKEHKADIIAMSALLTVTASEQERTIKTLREEGFREAVKVMVGGGAITQDFADKIGADGYAPTAPEAVNLAKTLIGR
jgi:methanogenic corrinoid protein MtbC1